MSESLYKFKGKYSGKGKFLPTEIMDKHVYLTSLFGGAMAGLAVDMSLYPLDTIKTRLQAPQGFKNAGGFKGIYKGIGPQFLGSAPQAALFFCTYESFKHHATPLVRPNAAPFVHMIGASLGEIVACLVRVPMEVIKQRKQTYFSDYSSWKIAVLAYRQEGFIPGLYRGFGSTVIREVPFSFIQFPILEYLKSIYKEEFNNNVHLSPYEVANCGAIAGAISAAITTPLDVVKTRIMLANHAQRFSKPKSLHFIPVFKQVYREGGIKGLFAGFVPRVVWITIGGYIYFGTYDFARSFFNDYMLDGAELDD